MSLKPHKYNILVLQLKSDVFCYKEVNVLFFRNSKHKMYHCSECYSKKKQNFVQMKKGFKITDTKAVVFKISVSQGCTIFHIFLLHRDNMKNDQY